MEESVSKVVDELHEALGRDVGYYAPMGQRGPVIHTVVDYEPIIVPPDYRYDELSVVCHDDGQLYTLENVVCEARALCRYDDAELCSSIADACAGKFERTGDDPSNFCWDGRDKPASEVLDRYEFESVVGVLNDAIDDCYEAVGVAYEAVVDRNAQFLTHEEAAEYLATGNYSRRAHTYCCHIPDGSLLARLLEAVGPVHH